MISSADSFAYVTGAIALLTVLFKVVCSQLPSAKIRLLLEILEDTDDLLSSAINEGYVAPNFIPVYSTALARQNLRKEGLHAQVRGLSTVAGELIAMKRLSVSIFQACKDATNLRVEIATHSEKERSRLGRTPEPPALQNEPVIPIPEQRHEPVINDAPGHSLFMGVTSLLSAFRDRDTTHVPVVTSRSPSLASTLVDMEESRCSLYIALPPPCASVDRERGRSRCQS